MKQFCTCLCIWFLCALTANAQRRWQQTDEKQLSHNKLPIRATRYLSFTTDEAELKSQLYALSKEPEKGRIIELPMPDGTTGNFKVWYSPIMPDKLAAKYPELRTFTGEEVGNRNVTAKLDFTPSGFHAIIFGANTSFIDPYDDVGGRLYIVHYKKDETREWNERMKCATPGKVVKNEDNIPLPQTKSSRTANGYTHRTYRLALACDHYYAQAATGLPNPTIAQTLSAMVTAMNRVNGVYEREFSLSMTFTDNEDTLIWTQAIDPINGADPYNTIDSNAGACWSTNQSVCDTRIGNANYDIGHVFTTGAGGLSQVGTACRTGMKAQSVTGQPDPVGDGFTIDYVSHEMGHEYGASHPFNSSAGDCGFPDNFYQPDSYEPGSGSTIMAYAGICSPDDLQPHSDPYFHSVNLEEIQSYITTLGDGCAIKTPTNNKLVSVPSFAASYTIPYKTPFELTVTAATDSVADTSVTYCWEQWNIGNNPNGTTFINTHQYGPIFRSYNPVTTTTRIFPKNSMVLSGILSNAGTEDNEGEKAPDVARFLTFQLTARDIYQGYGCFVIPDDTVHVDVVNTGADTFTVTSQNVAGLSYVGYSPASITWNVVGTNAAPVNASNVDIYMSVDGGNTWQYHVGTFPNSGAAIVTIPNPDTDTHTARIKVKGANNIFFNVNRADFTVTHSTDPNEPIAIFPIPVHDMLHIYGGTKGILNTVICNSIGQQVWKGQIDGVAEISVVSWARGLYFIKLIDVNSHHTVKKIVVE